MRLEANTRDRWKALEKDHIQDPELILHPVQTHLRLVRMWSQPPNETTCFQHFVSNAAKRYTL